MRRKVSVFIIITICFLLQTTLFQTLSFASISPNLLIIVVSSFGFMRGKKRGCISALPAGFCLISSAAEFLDFMRCSICISAISTAVSAKCFTRKT